MKQLIFLAFLLMITFTSCKPIIFTNSMRERIQSENENDIEKVQFFNDEKIVLVYQTISRDKSIKGGSVKFKNGEYYYYIKIPKNTPAIAKHLDNERLKVYFENGKNSYLIFGDNYKDDDEYYQLYGNRKGVVLYVDFEGKSFKVTEGIHSKLIIKKNIDSNVKADKRKVRGVKI